MLTQNADLLWLRGDRVVSVRFYSLNLSLGFSNIYFPVTVLDFPETIEGLVWILSQMIKNIFIKLSLTSILKSPCEFCAEVFKLFLFLFFLY